MVERRLTPKPTPGPLLADGSSNGSASRPQQTSRMGSESVGAPTQALKAKSAAGEQRSSGVVLFLLCRLGPQLAINRYGKQFSGSPSTKHYTVWVDDQQIAETEKGVRYQARVTDEAISWVQRTPHATAEGTIGRVTGKYSYFSNNEALQVQFAVEGECEQVEAGRRF